jgi:hypothetical protein
MRVLGLVLAGALALTAPKGVQAGSLGPGSYIQCLAVGTVTGVEPPVPRANGTADRFRRVGARIVLLVDGVPMAGPGFRLIGSTFPGAQSLITPSQIGEARPVAGVIRSQPGARPLWLGFQSAERDLIPRCETSQGFCRS